MRAGRRQALSVFVGLAVLLAPLKAAQADGSLAPAAWPPTGDYRIDTARTEVLFGVRALGFATYYGAFSGAVGALNFDRQSPSESRLEIHVPTTTLLAPSQAMTGLLKGPRWLDVAAYPEMVFKADKISLTSPTTATVSGILTLHGRSRPLVLEARFDPKRHGPPGHPSSFGFQARGRLKRSDYNLTGPAPLVSDEVQLILGASFEPVTDTPQGAIRP